MIGVQLAARFEVIAENRVDVRHGRSAFEREGVGDIGRLPIFRQRAEPFFHARVSFFLNFFFWKLLRFSKGGSKYKSGFFAFRNFPLSVPVESLPFFRRTFRWNSGGIPVEFYLFDSVPLRHLDRSRNAFRWNSGGKQKRDQVAYCAHLPPISAIVSMRLEARLVNAARPMNSL